MSNELMIPGDDLPALQSADDAKLDKLAQSGFLPYVLLMGSSSNQVKEGKARVGTYVLMKSKERFVDLGQSFEALVLGRRARATRKTMRGILSYFDQDNEEYKKVERDSQTPNSNCWHGTEYLIWIREQRCFATYHAASATARSASQDLNGIFVPWKDALIGNAKLKKEGKATNPVKNPQAKFTCALITYSNGNKQHGPVFVPATTPFSEVPDGAEVLEQCTKFAKPPQSTTETVAASDVEDRG